MWPVMRVVGSAVMVGSQLGTAGSNAINGGIVLGCCAALQIV